MRRASKRPRVALAENASGAGDDGCKNGSRGRGGRCNGRGGGKTAAKRGRSSVCPETRGWKDACRCMLRASRTRGVSVSLSSSASSGGIAYVRAYVRACVRACVRAYVRACVRALCARLNARPLR